MKKTYRFAFCVFLQTAVGGWAQAAAVQVPVISYAEKPIRLIRGTVLYQGVRGVELQDGDLIETGEAGIQIERLNATTVALGPGTKLYVGQSEGVTELGLVEGWLKVHVKKVNEPSVTKITMPQLRVNAFDGALIVHVATLHDAIFAEEGAHSIQKRNEGVPTETPLIIAEGKFFHHKAQSPWQLSSRPSGEFISAMPRSFRDPLIPVAMRLKDNVAPKKEHDVAYDDMSKWLTTDIGLKKKFVERFKPRLKDPEFRSGVYKNLGHTPEWRSILRSSRFRADAPKLAEKPAAKLQ